MTTLTDKLLVSLSLSLISAVNAAFHEASPEDEAQSDLGGLSGLHGPAHGACCEHGHPSSLW